MPVTLDDATALLVFKALTRLPPVSGQAILAVLEEQGGTLAEQGKLLLELSQKVNEMSQTQSQTDQDFQTELAGMREDMSKQTSVVNAMKVFVAGIAQKLADAEQHAIQSGATAEELSAIRSLRTDLQANTNDIAAATTENTPAQNEPTTPVEPTTTVDPAAVQG